MCKVILLYTRPAQLVKLVQPAKRVQPARLVQPAKLAQYVSGLSVVPGGSNE